jgi:hypothetical protein
MKRMYVWLQNIILKPLESSFTRFPLAIIYSFLLGIVMVSNDQLQFNWLTSVAQALFLFLPIAIALVLARETFTWWKWSIWIDWALLLLGTVSFYIFVELETRIGVEFSRFSNLGFGFYLLPLFLGYYQETNAIEVPITVGITKIFTALFYALILFFGLAVILLSTNILFNLSITLSTYANTFILSMTYVFVPTWLGSFIAPKTTFDLGKDLPLIWQRAFLFVIAPVISLFMIFILIYLLTGLLQNQEYNAGIYTISTLVISFAGISTHVLSKSFRKTYQLIALFQRFFPIVLVVVLVGYYVELIRLGLFFGFSIGVMLQLLMGVWPMVYVYLVLRNNQRATQRALLSLVSVYVWAAVMPFGNVVGLSRLALNIQYTQTIERLEMLDEEDNIQRRSDLSDEDYQQLFAILSSMNVIGFDQFNHVPEGYDHPNEFELTYGTRANDDTPFEREDYGFRLADNVIDLSMFDYDHFFYVPNIRTLEDAPYTSDTINMALVSDTDEHAYVWTITLGNETTSIELYEDVVLVLRDRFADDEPSVLDYEAIDANELKMTFNGNGFSVDLWVLNVNSFKGFYTNFSMSLYVGITLI